MIASLLFVALLALVAVPHLVATEPDGPAALRDVLRAEKERRG